MTIGGKLLGFRVEFRRAPGFAMLTRGDLRLLLNAPGAGGAGQPMPDGRKVVEGQGGRQIVVDDPAGNPVELFEPAPRGR